MFTGCPPQCSDTISGWAGWVLVHTEFWSSVNQGADYANHNTACLPGFEKLMASMIC